ncbi:MAG TPA: hypothetical protein VGR81_00980 [Candidatus Acidoferrales bacterium]|nr:hypothetical protein [Candidatus Acidoferrales bacterium]
MSPNDPPHKILLDPKFYKTISARRTSQGLPPLGDSSPFASAPADDADEREQKALDELRRRAAEEEVEEERNARAARSSARPILKHRRETIPGFDRHRRKCQICNHDYMEDIEEAYFNWTSAAFILEQFDIACQDTIYRHARTVGLDVQRRENSRFAIEKLIEDVDHVTVTGSTVIRAVRALSLIDGKGRWTDPPAKHIILRAKDLSCQGVASITGPPLTLKPADALIAPSVTQPAAPSANSGPQQSVISSTASPASTPESAPPPNPLPSEGRGKEGSSLVANHSPLNSNRLSYEELEVDLTHTKQKGGGRSNR